MKFSHWLLIVLGTLGVVLVLLVVSRSDYQDLQADYDALEANQSSLGQQNSSLSSQLTQSQTEAAKLQTDYDAVNNELTDIKKAYPARHFSSVGELENWLLLNDVSEQPWVDTYEGWYAKALQVQQDASKDGYIVSVQYHFCDERQVIEYIACVAFIDGYLWMWDPETDDVFPDYTFGKIT